MWTKKSLKQEFGYLMNMQNENQFVQVWNQIIRDQYRKAVCIKDYVVIPNDIYSQVSQLTKGKFSKPFWRYKSRYIFCSEKEFANIQSKWKKLSAPKGVEKRSGIYGIYKDDKLVYIGYTSRDFQDRFKEHRNIIYGKEEAPKNMKLYSIIHKGENLCMKELICKNDVKCEDLTERDLKAMELALITLYQPEGNLQGVTMNYKF